MRTHKSGLHKDVQSIFDGVWNPATDNVGQPFEAPVVGAAAYFDSAAQPLVNQRPEKRKSGRLFRACRDASGYIFRTRARRERKRLSSISKHLMINMQS
ncbi:MAG: hypothetical protein ACYSWO_06125 [Planctomycetota bacterium]|jgi:hypothetical protein